MHSLSHSQFIDSCTTLLCGVFTEISIILNTSFDIIFFTNVGTFWQEEAVVCLRLDGLSLSDGQFDG